MGMFFNDLSIGNRTAMLLKSPEGLGVEDSKVPPCGLPLVTDIWVCLLTRKCTWGADININSVDVFLQMNIDK